MFKYKDLWLVSKGTLCLYIKIYVYLVRELYVYT